MSVVIEYLQGGGGGSSVLTFTDTFNRADQPFYVGDQWAVTPLSFSTCLGPNIAASMNVAGNQLQLSICSSDGFNGLMLWPIPITWDKVFGVSQFSQASISADNSGGANFAFNGPSCLLDTNKNTGYLIETNIIVGVGNSVGKYSVVANNGAAAQTVINNNGGAGFSFALNDLLRIEASINTPVAGQTTVRSFKNGVQQSSDVHNPGYSFGVFGIMDFFVSAGVTQSWQNFKGGAL